MIPIQTNFIKLRNGEVLLDNPIISFEELYDAYLDCVKNKKNSTNAQDFMMDECPNLYRLWYELNTGKYKIGKSISFVVHKPVDREIFAANFRDRIIHHLIIKRLMPFFEKEFIEDSFSCRVGKGTTGGINTCVKQIQEFSENYTKETYILKCDLSAYFMTIDKELLENKLHVFIDKYITDPKDNWFYKYIVSLVIYNCPQKNCIIKSCPEDYSKLPPSKSLFHCDDFHGLPIGNLTSQIFANYFLTQIDHIIIEELGFKNRYGRYVDDFYLLSYSKSELIGAKMQINMMLKELGVILHPKKCYIQEVRKGINFLGKVIKPNRLYIGNRTKGNFYQCIKKSYKILEQLEECESSIIVKYHVQHFCQQINSYLGFMKNCKSFKIRRKMITKMIMETKWANYIDADIVNFLKIIPKPAFK